MLSHSLHIITDRQIQLFDGQILLPKHSSATRQANRYDAAN